MNRKQFIASVLGLIVAPKIIEAKPVSVNPLLSITDKMSRITLADKAQKTILYRSKKIGTKFTVSDELFIASQELDVEQIKRIYQIPDDIELKYKP